LIRELSWEVVGGIVGIRSEERLPLNWGTRWVGIAEVFARSFGRPTFRGTIAYSLFMLSKKGMGWRQTNHSAPELLLPPVQTEREITRLEAHCFLSIRLFGTLSRILASWNNEICRISRSGRMLIQYARQHCLILLQVSSLNRERPTRLFLL
jgi:hypothetical protein